MAEIKPFTPRTTEAIERANRFMALRDHPAYNDLFRLSQSLLDEARQAQEQFAGWDKDQIVTLAIRVKVAREYHDTLFARIAEAIQAGVNEARQSISDREVAAQSDQLRAEVFSQIDSDVRVAGSH